MTQYEFLARGTVFISVSADNKEDAERAAKEKMGHVIGLPQASSDPFPVSAVIVSAGSPLELNKVDGREDWDEGEQG